MNKEQIQVHCCPVITNRDCELALINRYFLTLKYLRPRKGTNIVELPTLCPVIVLHGIVLI